jgi:hypothetical protein
MRTAFLLLASSLASLTIGCGSDHAASMQDNLGLELNLGNDNILHTPYVAGSRFNITLQAGPHTTNDGWKLTSSDPTVLQVGATGAANSGAFNAVAAGAGHTTLTVTDKSGNVIDSADVDVDVPTRIQLCEQGLLYAGYSDDQAALTSVQVVNGGTATFLARYFSGSQELFGNNALTASNTTVALASVTSTSLSASDFVEITGIGTGMTTVPLAAGGTTLNVPVTVVDPTAVKKVTLAPQSENGASDGQQLHVFARAFDANGADVYGSSFAWSVDGNTPSCCPNSPDPSDLLFYQYHSSGTENVAASLDGQSASTTVHGTPSSTNVSSSENVGCSVARGVGAGGSAGAVGTFLLGLVVLASRRLRSNRA